MAKHRKKRTTITQASLKRLRDEVGPRIMDDISRKFRRQVRPDEIDDVLNEGLEVVWESRDELAGRNNGEVEEYYHSACLEAARKWSASTWNRERRHEFGVQQAFLERFEARRSRDEHETLGGDGRALSPKQKKLLRKAIAELPEHERVIAKADLADLTGTAPAAPLAEKAGISRNTVYSRRKRYRERLRRSLEEEGLADD